MKDRVFSRRTRRLTARMGVVASSTFTLLVLVCSAAKGLPEQHDKRVR
jgi:hypothetical protein